jgi:DNA-binding transcriptional LysR family regulator
MAIELQHLAWFRAIAAHGSLSAAARRLAVSQP